MQLYYNINKNSLRTFDLKKILGDQIELHEKDYFKMVHVLGLYFQLKVFYDRIYGHIDKSSSRVINRPKLNSKLLNLSVHIVFDHNTSHVDFFTQFFDTFKKFQTNKNSSLTRDQTKKLKEDIKNFLANSKSIKYSKRDFQKFSNLLFLQNFKIEVVN